MIDVAEPILDGNELKYVEKAIKEGRISSGRFVTEFEEKFAEFCGTKHAVAVSNGTVALHLALLSLGIKEGDEVIVPNITFVASANAVKYCGANPVFVDVDKDTWNLDVSKIEEIITKKTKAIMVVHLYGHPCEMGPVMELAEKHNLFVIEDAAEAHGAEYKGLKVGSIGHVGCFSFYGNKIITTGEGGMCTTNNKEIEEKIRNLKDHGMSKEKKYWHNVVGFNYRMTNVQAAIGLAQLERINEFIEKKRQNAQYYNEKLKNLNGISLPVEKEWAKNVYWMYSLIINEDFGMSRDELISKLKEKGVDSRPFFFPVNEMPPYKSPEHFPVSKRLSEMGINLPSSPKLTKEQIDYISDCIIKCNQKAY